MHGQMAWPPRHVETVPTAMARRLAMTWPWIGILVSDARFLVFGSSLPGFPNCHAESPSTPSGRFRSFPNRSCGRAALPINQLILDARSRHPDPSRTTSRVAVKYSTGQ